METAMLIIMGMVIGQLLHYVFDWLGDKIIEKEIRKMKEE